MALEADFLEMTTDTITIADPSTMSKYGAPTYGSASSPVPTRIEQGQRVSVTVEGIEQVATMILYVLSTTAVVSPQSKVTLPDGSHPEILSVQVLNDEEGQHHLEIFARQ